jgi:glycine cleavage system H lipoate-binding protein
MKNLFVLLTTYLISSHAFCQDTLNYAHCNCYDIIDSLKPLPSGIYKRVCNNTIIEFGNFQNGLKHGKWTSFSLSGTVIKTINYSNGELNGEFAYFYNSGKIKLSGSFLNARKQGDWKFFNEQGKMQWSLTFQNGKPSGKSLMYDKKGKKVLISYDYSTDSYEVNTPNSSLFDDPGAVLENPTSAEWFFLVVVDPTQKTKELKLDKSTIESELLKSVIEIPSELFNTYVNVNYNVEYEMEDYGVNSVILVREDSNGDEFPMFNFTAMTNDPEKLNKIDPSEFSLLLLDSKMKEAFSLFSPWTIKEGKLNVAFVYTINKIEGREVLDKK